MFDNLITKILSYEAREALFLSEVERRGLIESYRIGLLAAKFGVDTSRAEGKAMSLTQREVELRHSRGSVNVWHATIYSDKLPKFRDVAELDERLTRAFWHSELDFDMQRYGFGYIAPATHLDLNIEDAMKMSHIYGSMNSYVGDDAVNARMSPKAWAYHIRRYGDRALITIDDTVLIREGGAQGTVRRVLANGRANFLIYTSTWLRSVSGGSYELLHKNVPLRWTATFEAR